MANENEVKKSSEDKLESFFYRTKYMWIGLLCAVAVALVVVCIVVGVSSANKKKSANILEDAVFNYELSKSTMDIKSAADAETELISTLQDYVAKKGKNKNTIRFYMTLASVYMEQKDYKSALENWKFAAKSDRHSYLAGIANYNAGVCCEQLGKLDEAEVFYSESAKNKAFHLKPHALFSQARVLEALNKNNDALDIYSKIVDAYSEDEWANLAKSRIFILKAEDARQE